jgi:RNA polymerase sigma-70 factor, ECF subfamily
MSRASDVSAHLHPLAPLRRLSAPEPPARERASSLVAVSRDVASSAPRACPIEEAMERFASGDEAAFARVYSLAVSPIYRFLLRLTRQPALAEDLTQDTLLRIYEARGSWLRGGKVLPWAYRIARHLFVDQLRRRRSEETAHDILAVSQAASCAAIADEQIAARRAAEVIAEALERLPPGQREAFQMVKTEGISLTRASAKLGSTHLSVRLRVHRACRALQAAVQGH